MRVAKICKCCGNGFMGKAWENVCRSCELLEGFSAGTVPAIDGETVKDVRPPNHNLSTPQCSSGITQSRPFPARAVKIMESAGQQRREKDAGAAATEAGKGQNPDAGPRITLPSDAAPNRTDYLTGQKRDGGIKPRTHTRRPFHL